MFYRAFVCLFVFLSVCLLATSRKNYTDRILMKILPDIVYMDKK